MKTDEIPIEKVHTNLKHVIEIIHILEKELSSLKEQVTFFNEEIVPRQKKIEKIVFDLYELKKIEDELEKRISKLEEQLVEHTTEDIMEELRRLERHIDDLERRLVKK